MNIDPFVDDRDAKDGVVLKIRRRVLLHSSPMVSLLMAVLATFGRRWLLSDVGGPTVSLTSYGARLAKVHRTIESIGRGSLRPSRIVLWIDDPDLFASLPRGVRRLQRRGLEVRLTENRGPHTKYYPFVLEDARPDQAFVTADDDIVYPRWWLSRLVAASVESPGHIVCHRAHRVDVRDSHVAPYLGWGSVHSTEPHPSVFATGVSGVLYPPEMRGAIRSAGDGFRTASKSCDDVWLHVVAVDNRIPIRQVTSMPKHFWITPGSQGGALMGANLSGANDTAAAALYAPYHLAEMTRPHGSRSLS